MRRCVLNRELVKKNVFLKEFVVNYIVEEFFLIKSTNHVNNSKKILLVIETINYRIL
jgi:hypothetical protein